MAQSGCSGPAKATVSASVSALSVSCRQLGSVGGRVNRRTTDDVSSGHSLSARAPSLPCRRSRVRVPSSALRKAPLQRAIQASQQLYLDISGVADDACTAAHRLALAAIPAISVPASDALVMNAYLRNPKFNLGGSPAEWDSTLARLVYDLKLVYEA